MNSEKPLKSIKTARILAKSFSKRLKKFGYDKHDVIAVISEMLEIIIKEIKIEK